MRRRNGSRAHGAACFQVACHTAFFFSIAERERHPPWGVTANMCVPGRSNNSIWFNCAYPKTGGGEDVEFCLRMKAWKAGESARVALGLPGQGSPTDGETSAIGESRLWCCGAGEVARAQVAAAAWAPGASSSWACPRPSSRTRFGNARSSR